MRPNYAGIPHELKPRNQWVCWRNVHGQKLPHNPNGGHLAAVDNPSTWNAYEYVVMACEKFPDSYEGPAFVFTENDPYTMIDIDLKTVTDPAIIERYMNLIETFDSYTEVSPSGKGYHIYVEGKVEAGRRGTRNSKFQHIEIYSTSRYSTITGHVYRAKPIANRQNMLVELWEQLHDKDTKTNGAYPAVDPQFVNEQMLFDDQTVYSKCVASTAFGERFVELWNGRWTQYQPHLYPSQSEADQAIMNMIGLYTRNRDQIKRMFLSCGLGQRDKARKRPDYIEFTLNKALDNVVDPAEIERMQASLRTLKENAPGALEQSGGAVTDSRGGAALSGYTTEGSSHVSTDTQKPVMDASGQVNSLSFPPGLVGDIAQFIYAAAPKPLFEAALCGALGLMAGICGRTFNTPTGAGLNMYTICIAETGTGKDAMRTGIAKLVNAVAAITPKARGTTAVPSIMELVEFGDFQSHQALMKIVVSKPCCVAITGEAGLLIRDIAGSTQMHLSGMLRKLLELYTSGENTIVGGLLYSQKEQNVANIQQPAFSWLCETTPSVYYQAISRELVAAGLIPRFFCMESFDDSELHNPNAANVRPSDHLVQALGQLVAYCHSMMQRAAVCTLQFDQDAAQAQERFRLYCDNQRRQAVRTDDATKQLWSRAYLKAMKLASSISVGMAQHVPIPTITGATWDYAERLIVKDVMNVVNHFESGNVGVVSANKDQDESVVRVIMDYVTKPWEEIERYVPLTEGKLMHELKFIPQSYLSNRLQRSRGFHGSKDVRLEIYKVLRDFITKGILRVEEHANKLPAPYDVFKSTSKVYFISDIETFVRTYRFR